jgi:hypothetical protein
MEEHLALRTPDVRLDEPVSFVLEPRADDAEEFTAEVLRVGGGKGVGEEAAEFSVPLSWGLGRLPGAVTTTVSPGRGGLDAGTGLQRPRPNLTTVSWRVFS